MMKTERLYYTDCYLREFEGRVLRAEPCAEGSRVYLDRSAFYPASGGQPADRGTLGNAEILDVIDEGDAVAHLLDRVPESELAHGVIDWHRRFDHMQQHTGQHVLSAAFERTAEFETVSFHLGEEISSIDLASDRTSVRQVEEAESLANQVVFDNRAVAILFRTSEEARQMSLRKPAAREGELRLIRVEDFDLSACGGTHVNRTGSIGLIAVRKIERMKGQTRVEFVCGGRALACARRDFRTLSEAGRALSSAPEKLPELVCKQSDEIRGATKSIEKLSHRVAEYRGRELWAAAPVTGSIRIIRHIFNGDEAAEAKMVAQAATRLPACVFLIGVQGEPAALYFARSEDGGADMGSVLKKTLAGFGGKGGGTQHFAQGGGLPPEHLEEALVYAEGLLLG
jgi:alanyl-tRNA synthetase